MSAPLNLERASAPDAHEPRRVPEISENGLVTLDPWWGTIQPHQLHPDLPTWGEIELIEHLESGGQVIDTRQPEYVEASGTIPGSLVITWEEISRHLDLFHEGETTALFCNGPQCAATPRAVSRLLKSGVEPADLAYYRGGIQDWVGLGLPTVPSPS